MRDHATTAGAPPPTSTQDGQTATIDLTNTGTTPAAAGDDDLSELTSSLAKITALHGKLIEQLEEPEIATSSSPESQADADTAGSTATEPSTA